MNILHFRAGLLALALSADPCSAADEIRLPLVPNGAMRQIGSYVPQRLAVSANKPSGIVKAPADLAAPLYGVLKLGPSDRLTSYFVILDEPNGAPSRLFVDTNGNGDLTDDPASEWSPRTARGKDGADYTQYSGGALVNLTFGGEAVPLRVAMYRFDKRDPGRAGLDGFVFYYSDYARAGSIALNGQEYRAILADRITTGDFRGKAGKVGPAGVLLLLDVNGNGKFEDATEMFDIRQPFNLGGTTYEVAGMTASGESFRLEKSAQKVAERKAPPPGPASGKPALPFQAKTTEGKSVDFPSSYTGKIVLLDFWATWCGPCVAELPNLTAAYNKYHDQGFEVLGISLDREGDGRKLADFTRSKKMPWPQVFDGKYWSADVARLYKINAIPKAYLVDGDTGMIIAADGLRGPALDGTIRNALAREKAP